MRFSGARSKVALEIVPSSPQIAQLVARIIQVFKELLPKRQSTDKNVNEWFRVNCLGQPLCQIM